LLKLSVSLGSDSIILTVFVKKPVSLALTLIVKVSDVAVYQNVVYFKIAVIG